MRRPTGSAESTMNSETSFAADPVTTNTFPAARRRRHFLHNARIAIGVMQIA
jgi:hypothetical protein